MSSRPRLPAGVERGGGELQATGISSAAARETAAFPASPSPAPVAWGSGRRRGSSTTLPPFLPCFLRPFPNPKPSPLLSGGRESGVRERRRWSSLRRRGVPGGRGGEPRPCLGGRTSRRASGTFCPDSQLSSSTAVEVPGPGGAAAEGPYPAVGHDELREPLLLPRDRHWGGSAQLEVGTTRTAAAPWAGQVPRVPPRRELREEMDMRRMQR